MAEAFLLANRPRHRLIAAIFAADIAGLQPTGCALADCVKRDSNCQVIAIDRFLVGPN